MHDSTACNQQHQQQQQQRMQQHVSPYTSRVQLHLPFIINRTLIWGNLGNNNGGDITSAAVTPAARHGRTVIGRTQQNPTISRAILYFKRRKISSDEALGHSTCWHDSDTPSLAHRNLTVDLAVTFNLWPTGRLLQRPLSRSKRCRDIQFCSDSLILQSGWIATKWMVTWPQSRDRLSLRSVT